MTVVSHDSGTVVGENPLKKLKDARERDHPKGIDASESHGGLRFFAKSSYSELELRDSSLGFGQLFSKRRPLPAMSQAHSLLFPAPSHSRNLISSVGNFSFFDFTRHIPVSWDSTVV